MKNYDNILLGYRDYNEDEMYGKDFQTLDSVVEWFTDLGSWTEATKEFFDFVEERYGIDQLVLGIDRLYPKFGASHSFASTREYVMAWFNDREMCMKASDFADTKIP